MNPQVEPMPADGDGLTRLGRLELPRWAGAVFPPVFVAAFGFACLILTNQTFLPAALEFAAAGGLGLVAGFAARRALRRRAYLTRALVALAGLTIGLLLLGILTWGRAGVGPFGLTTPNPNWMGLAQLLLASASAWLTLRAWRPAAPPSLGTEQASGHVPAPAGREARLPTNWSERTRRFISAARGRGQVWAGLRWFQRQYSRAARWVAHRLPVRLGPEARRTSELAINEAAGHMPAASGRSDLRPSQPAGPRLAGSNRGAPAQDVPVPRYGPAGSERGTWRQSQLQHLTRPWQAFRERVAAAWPRRLRVENTAGGRARVRLPGSARTSGVSLPRGLRRRVRVRFTGAVTDCCPFCLELVAPDDPRGVTVCPVCHTRHHADCWAVTGMCQVPHQQF